MLIVGANSQAALAIFAAHSVQNMPLSFASSFVTLISFPIDSPSRSSFGSRSPIRAAHSSAEYAPGSGTALLKNHWENSPVQSMPLGQFPEAFRFAIWVRRTGCLSLPHCTTTVQANAGPKTSTDVSSVIKRPPHVAFLF